MVYLNPVSRRRRTVLLRLGRRPAARAALDAVLAHRHYFDDTQARFGDDGPEPRQALGRK